MSTRVPGFHAGFFFLIALSVTVALFGVWGWVQSDAAASQKWLFGSLTLAVAFAIPTVSMVIGKSWISGLVLFPVLVFSMITAYSTHNAYAVLLDAPRKDAHMASAPVTEAQALVDEAERVLAGAREAIADFPALVIPDSAGPLKTGALTAAWEAQRAPLTDALDAAKADREAAQADLDARRDAYEPMAPDLAVWLAGGLIDLAIVVAIFCLEMTKVGVAKRIRREADAAADREVRADADRIMAEKVQTAIGRGSANVTALREAAARLRGEKAA